MTRVLLLLLICAGLGWAQVDAATRLGQQGGDNSTSNCTVIPCAPQRSIDQALSGDTISWSNAGGALVGSVSFSSRSNLTLTGNGTANLTTTSGACLTITNSTNITVKAMNIGPCGAANGSGLGTGVDISGSTGTNIWDSYIHVETRAVGCCDTRNAIWVHNSSDSTEIYGNVVTYGDKNISGLGPGINGLTVIGNYSRSPQGATLADPFPGGTGLNCWGNSAGGCLNVTMNNNYLHCSPSAPAAHCTDYLNFGYVTTGTANNNYFKGTGSIHYDSGCGLIADQFSDGITFNGNKFDNTGHCQITAATSVNMDINGNLGIVRNDLEGFVDCCDGPMTVYTSVDGPCSNIQVRNNIMGTRKSTGVIALYWEEPGVCTGVVLTNNQFGASAFTALEPFATTNPPPLIPPLPKNCVAVSPFTTQTGTSCNAVADTTAPSIPTGLGLTVVSATRIDLSWTASTDDTAVTGYDIWRCAGAACPPSFVITPPGTATTYQDTGLTGGILYRYQVAARDAAGHVSALSTPIQQATTPAADVTPPASTTGLTVTLVGSNPSRLFLDWAANGEGDLAGYRVYRCQGAGCTPTVLQADVALLSDYVERGLLGNTIYRYRVTAYDTSTNESALGSATIVQNTTPVIPANSPELLLDFEVGVGSTVYDESGHGHNSSVSTGTFVASAPSGGGSFSGNYNGTQETRIPRLSGAGPSGLEPTAPTAFTLAAWVNRNGTQSSFSTIAGKSWGNSTAPAYTSYKLLINPGGTGTDRVGCEIGFGATAPNVLGLSSLAAALPDLTWTHVACTYNPSAGAPQWNLYVNGALTLGGSATQTTSLAYDASTAGDFYVSGTGSGVEHMNGLVDEVRMYPRALNAAEIQQLAGVGPLAPPAAPTNLRVVSP